MTSTPFWFVKDQADASAMAVDLKGFDTPFFRGTFDVRASDINEEMKMAAAKALAEFIPEDKLSADYIIPKAFEEGVGKAVAEAVANAARWTGVARI